MFGNTRRATFEQQDAFRRQFAELTHVTRLPPDWTVGGDTAVDDDDAPSGRGTPSSVVGLELPVTQATPEPSSRFLSGSSSSGGTGGSGSRFAPYTKKHPMYAGPPKGRALVRVKDMPRIRQDPSPTQLNTPAQDTAETDTDTEL